MSFWGATVSSSKPFEESVPTNANLVVSHVSLAGPTDGVTTLMCTVEGTEGDFVVAHLSWGRNEQASVDLVYPLGTDVKFTVKGKGEVHLIGMYDPIDSMGYDDSDDEEGMMFGSEDSDLDGEEDSDEALRMQYGTGRGPRITELPEGSDDEEEDSEDEGIAVPVQQPKKQQQGQQQKQGGQQGQKQGQKQGGQQGQKQGGQQGQKQGGQQGQQQKQGGGQQQGNQQGQKRKIPIQDVSNQPQQKKQKTGQSPNNQQKRK